MLFNINKKIKVEIGKEVTKFKYKWNIFSEFLGNCTVNIKTKGIEK